MKKNPRIINVIEMEDNTILSIDTFIIPIKIKPYSKEEKEIVNLAEKLFIEIALVNGMDKEELDTCLEDGFYENGTYKVAIHWSNDSQKKL
jgi:hypothetical protein